MGRPKCPGPANPVRLAVAEVGGPESCAQLLGVSLRTIYHWTQRGNLRGVAVDIVLQLAELSRVSIWSLAGWDMTNAQPSTETKGSCINGSETQDAVMKVLDQLADMINALVVEAAAQKRIADGQVGAANALAARYSQLEAEHAGCNITNSGR